MARRKLADKVPSKFRGHSILSIFRAGYDTSHIADFFGIPEPSVLGFLTEERTALLNAGHCGPVAVERETPSYTQRVYGLARAS